MPGRTALIAAPRQGPEWLSIANSLAAVCCAGQPVTQVFVTVHLNGISYPMEGGNEVSLISVHLTAVAK